jgi:hypothetical protein
MPAETIRVKGLREFVRACDHAGRDTKREVRSAFRDVGETVRAEWSRRFATVDARSAAGYRVSVRQRGVSVVQSLRKTTGLHPEYGSLQERYGIGALRHEQHVVEDRLEHAIDRVADNFDR